MNRFYYTLIFSFCVIGLCDLKFCIFLICISLYSRIWPMIIGLFLALILSVSYDYLPATQTAFCHHDKCYWAHSSSAVASFFLREARIFGVQAPQEGWYKVVRHKDTLSLSYMPPEAAHSERYIGHHRWATSQVFEAIIRGATHHQNIITQLYSRFGMSHLLCLSAWHVQSVLRLIPAQRSLIITLLFFMALILGAPFPLTRALIAAALPQGSTREECLEMWSLSWLITLGLSPFAWSSWAFWLSLYYGALFVYTKPCREILRLSNIFWIAYWGLYIDPLCFFIGHMIEPFFIFLMIAGWLSFPLSFVVPDFIERFWGFLMRAFLAYDSYSWGIIIPSLPCVTLFIIAFLCQCRYQKILFEFFAPKVRTDCPSEVL